MCLNSLIHKTLEAAYPQNNPRLAFPRGVKTGAVLRMRFWYILHFLAYLEIRILRNRGRVGVLPVHHTSVWVVPDDVGGLYGSFAQY